MASTSIKDVNQNNHAIVDDDGNLHVAVTGGGLGNNDSVGPNGDTAPGSSTQIAGVDPNGNLTPVAVTTDGAVKVDTSTGFSTIASGFPKQVSVGNTSVELFASNPNRKYLHIFNNSNEVIFIQYQVSASLNQGVKIGSGGMYTIDGSNLWLGSINAIGLISGQLIDLLEGE